MDQSRAKKWHLDLVDGLMYVFKNGSRLCVEGGPTSGELYGEIIGASKATSKSGKEVIKVISRTILSVLASVY